MTVYDQIDKVVEFLRKRAHSYQLTFQKEQPANLIVLEDLARFCRANETCVVPGDTMKTYILEGRREVWLRIQQHLRLTPEQLFALYNADYSKFNRSDK
jgi:hypothetical protein